MICDRCDYRNELSVYWKSLEGEATRTTCSKCKQNPYFADLFKEALRACPFCGGKAIIISSCGDSSQENYTVECDECGADIGLYNTKEEASRVWNKRTS